MKVLTFLSSISLKGGGPSRSVPMLVKGLAELGVNITLMTVRDDDMNTHAIEGTSAKLKVLEPGFTNKELEEYLLEEHFDVIQIQSIWEYRYHRLTKLAQKHHIPYIITPRGMLEPWSLAQKKWKKKLGLWLYQLADLKKSACIYTTAEMEAQHVRELGVKVPMSVIPNGIDTNGYSCRTDITMVKKQILFLSRIHIKKGIELLIDSFSHICTDYPEWKVVIVGNGEEEYIKSLKQRIASLGLNNCIEIINPVFGDAKIKLYHESAIFCLPSYSENFGMVIAEALCCGVPVITTNGTPWQLLNDNKLGWCIDLSTESLELALREAMSTDSQILYNMGQQGSQFVRDNFDYRSTAKKTKCLYEWIVTGNNMPSFVK